LPTLNLERSITNLERKYENLTGERIYYLHFADDEPEPIRREHEALGDLEKDQPLIDHLGDYHIVPIIKWKLSVGLETKIKPGRLFVNYGEDYENLTIEEEEWFRLLKKRHKVLGYDPRLDPNYKF
jgi:hypothetical protein